VGPGSGLDAVTKRKNPIIAPAGSSSKLYSCISTFESRRLRWAGPDKEYIQNFGESNTLKTKQAMGG
jgi:hypothetical protein